MSIFTIANRLKNQLSPIIASKLPTFDINNPLFMKAMINLYPPYVGAGVKACTVDYKKGVIRVRMPLTWFNQNIVGTQFGGSLYSMTDPFFMTLLMQKLGREYVVWDKSATIDFIKAAESEVFASFAISDEEVLAIKALAKDGSPVFRHYTVKVTDKANEVVADIQKTVYIRLRAYSKSKDKVSRF